MYTSVSCLVKIQKEIYTTSILLLERINGITLVISYTEKRSKRKGRNSQWIEKVRTLIKNYIRITCIVHSEIRINPLKGLISNLFLSCSQAGRFAGKHCVNDANSSHKWKLIFCKLSSALYFLNNAIVDMRYNSHPSPIRWL